MISELQISEYIRGLDAKIARVKYQSSKALRLAARESPETLYPYFDRFAGLLRGPTILRWNATLTIGYLSAADREAKVDRMLRSFCSPISGKEMIGAANTIAALAQIGQNKPHLAGRIVREILHVEQAHYATPECRNVAIGHAIVALGKLYPFLKQRSAVTRFVKRQLDNPRPATRHKAERFLKHVDRPK